MKNVKKLLTIGLAVLLMFCMSISLFGCEQSERLILIQNISKTASPIVNNFLTFFIDVLLTYKK